MFFICRRKFMILRKALVFSIILSSAVFLLSPALIAEVEKIDVEAILQAFVEDFAKNDKLPEEPLEFGIKVSGESEGEWTVAIDKENKVYLRKGFPEQPTFYITANADILNQIYRGEINALTAAGKARASDKTPMDFGLMEGYQPTVDYLRSVIIPLYFHFFTRGKPEIIKFGEQYSRYVHGGNAVILYYDKGLRTAWYQLKKGMYINKDLRDAVNNFPTLLIITRGEGKGCLGEKVMDLKEGMTIFIPAGMVHQFWTEDEAGFEAIIIMFGEGA
jgi:mannose-6-phosphate isomerase-like protein (cupin superfamily)/putative sterol carrier protein